MEHENQDNSDDEDVIQIDEKLHRELCLQHPFGYPAMLEELKEIYIKVYKKDNLQLEMWCSKYSSKFLEDLMTVMRRDHHKPLTSAKEVPTGVGKIEFVKVQSTGTFSGDAYCLALEMKCSVERDNFHQWWPWCTPREQDGLQSDVANRLLENNNPGPLECSINPICFEKAGEGDYRLNFRFSKNLGTKFPTLVKFGGLQFHQILFLVTFIDTTKYYIFDKQLGHYQEARKASARRGTERLGKDW